MFSALAYSCPKATIGAGALNCRARPSTNFHYSFNTQFLASAYSCPKATIGADDLNFRVRDGIGCDLIA